MDGPHPRDQGNCPGVKNTWPDSAATTIQSISRYTFLPLILQFPGQDSRHPAKSLAQVLLSPTGIRIMKLRSILAAACIVVVASMGDVESTQMQIASNRECWDACKTQLLECLRTESKFWLGFRYSVQEAESKVIHICDPKATTCRKNCNRIFPPPKPDIACEKACDKTMQSCEVDAVYGWVQLPSRPSMPNVGRLGRRGFEEQKQAKAQCKVDGDKCRRGCVLP